MRARGGHHHPHYGGDGSGNGSSYYGNNSYGGGGGGYSPYGAGSGAPGGGPSSAYGGYGSSQYNQGNYTNNYQDYNNATMPTYGGTSNADFGADADDSHNKYSKAKNQKMNESMMMHGICLGVMTSLALYLTFGCYWNTSKQYSQILELDDFSAPTSRGRKNKQSKPDAVTVG